uniref:Uncharacterized protein n=1 Tax=viral metagenome TaxID=1070528 RepID=A0A6C0EKZ2_9ZZZZ
MDHYFSREGTNNVTIGSDTFHSVHVKDEYRIYLFPGISAIQFYEARIFGPYL